MSTDQIAIVIILIFLFGMFSISKFRHDIIAILGLAFLVLLDTILGGPSSNLIIDNSQLFKGFGHPAVITVAAVLVLSKGLQRSGVVDSISKMISPLSVNKIVHIFSLSSVIAALSAFMNNVGALALMIPVALKTSWAQNRSPSIILMPIAFASILGGMITMIGTPPNIIISSLKYELLNELHISAKEGIDSTAVNYFNIKNIDIDSYEPIGFGLFDFTYVGLFVAILGIVFIATIGWKLIPLSSQNKRNTNSFFKIDDYVTEIKIVDGSKLIGKSVARINKANKDKIEIIASIFNKKAENVKKNHIINSGDIFLIKSDPDDLKIFMTDNIISFSKEIQSRLNKNDDSDSIFKEMIITPDSPLVGRNRNSFRRRTLNRVSLIAVARHSKPIHKRLGNVTFKVGDLLLLTGLSGDLDKTMQNLDLLPLAERGLSIKSRRKIVFSISVFTLSIIMSIANVFSISESFLIALTIYLLFGIVPVRDLYSSIDWPIIVLLGALMPISSAIQSTGLTLLISDFVTRISSSFPPWLIISFIMLITMCLSDIINNAATALIMAPISFSIAINSAANVEPYLMAVAIGASCAFLTPIGHQCNALILGPGSYRFGDYWRMGLPLEILIIIIGTPLILFFWPL